MLTPVVLVGALALAACDPGITPLDPSLAAKWIGRDPETVYGITVADGVTTVAKSSSAGDGRMVFWRVNDQVLGDQESCATVSDVSTAEDDIQQPGVALRISPNAETGTVKAITVSKNVIYTAYALINVHVMSSADGGDVPPPLSQVELRGLKTDPNGPLTEVKPYPWRMCARVVGQTVTFKVWPTVEPEPAWSNPDYTGSGTVAGPAWEGRPGFYAAHMEEGGEINYTNLSVDAL